MGSRERKRADRQKRKARSGERQADFGARMADRSAKTEAKNQAVRDDLEPLEPDERPGVVTIAALISGLLALGSLIAYIAGAEIATVDDFGTQTGEAKPNLFYTVISTGVLAMMAWGLWKARYWAVLGFQTILVLILVVTILALVQVTDVLRGLGLFAVLAIASLLFYRMVKAMARIQMPNREPRS